MTDLATLGEIEKAWRPLSDSEKPRAEYYLGVASRQVRRRWRDVDARITAGSLDKEDVSDVVVHMVLGVVDGGPRGAKSWSETEGPFARSVTLQAGRENLITIEPWMVEVFETGPATILPTGSFPASGRYDGLFQWSEGRR